MVEEAYRNLQGWYKTRTEKVLKPTETEETETESLLWHADRKLQGE